MLITVSSYTANLAAFIIKKDMVLSWADIDAATADGAKICVHTMLAPKMRTLYPDADFNARFMDVASDLNEGITVDGCDAFIMEIRAIKDPSIDQVRCDLGFVLTGTAVAELDVALPARPEAALQAEADEVASSFHVFPLNAGCLSQSNRGERALPGVCY